MSALPSIDPAALNRASINQANAQHSTGPRTAEGKARASRNALTHGLTSRSALLRSEDQAAYQKHCRQFFDEYRPATPTETHLTQELADTAWRLNRIPVLEAQLLNETATALEPNLAEMHRALATLSLHGARLSRQFQKTLQQLRELQAGRNDQRTQALKQAAALLELHKHKGLSDYNPAHDGFDFSKEEIETHSQRLMRQNEASRIAHLRFEADPQLVRAASL